MADSLADLVKLYRSGASLSQEALAERAGVSTRTIGDIETGFQRSPRLITVMLIAEALELGEADRERLRASWPKRAAATPSEVPARAALPDPIVLFGREEDLAAIDRLFARDDVRLVTLVGPAGVGKTSLAIAAARAATAHFADGVAFVALAALRDPALVPSEIAAHLGLRDGGAAVEEALMERIGSERRLLVLDNFEHLMPAAARIGKLLAACPQLRILTTSREMMHLRAERLYTIRPLVARAAVALFVERAQAVKSDFALTALTGDAVAAIVKRLEGLPLAIELAAPRLTLLPPAALLARLERRLPLLADGPVDSPQRQQTMHRAIAWSYDLLDADEQQLFARLAVFTGGATIEAAQAVVAAGASRSLLALLGALTEKSLLAVTDDDGEPRLAMLELLREFALERLEECDELDALQQRHAQYFLEFAQTGDNAMTGPNQAPWMQRLELELPNLRAALSWAIRSGSLDLGLQMGAALGRFWWLRGYVTEGRTWLDTLLAAVPSAAQPVAAGSRARALAANGQLLNVLGDFAEALVLCDRALLLAREAGDERAVALTLNSRGIALLMLGDLPAARAAHEEALALRRKLRDDFGVGSSLGSVASVLVALGNVDEAIARCEESVICLRRTGSSSAISVALSKLGYCLELTAEYDRAGALYEESLALQSALDDKANMVYSYYFLGVLARRQGRLDAARENLRHAFALLTMVGNKSLTADTLTALGEVLAAAGNNREAVRMFGAAQTLRIAINYPVMAHECAEYAALLGTIRAALDAATFDREWQHGATMPLAQILADEIQALESGPNVAAVSN